MPTYHSSPCPPAELEARLRLHRLPETGLRRFRTLLEAFGSASSALSAPGSAWRALGIGQASIDARRSAEVRDGAQAAMAWLERPGQHLLMWDGPDYPALLREIDDAPPLLFVAGNPALLDRPQLAIVGSRRATPRHSIRPGHFPATWPGRVSPLPAGSRWASMVPLIGRLWRSEGAPLVCSEQACKNFIHSATATLRG